MRIIWGGSIGWNMDVSKMEYTIITNGVDCYPWHEVYAWLPVKTITGKRVWMSKVFKRKIWVVWGTGFHMETEIEYATVFDMITDTRTSI